MAELFESYPLLKDKLPYFPLGNFPTPVEKLENIGRKIGLNNLYIKRDDLSATVYGGNKVRKLEFILGSTIKTGVKEVLTFGFAGSNHALATAIYANKLGLRSISMLFPQPNARYVQNNLLMSYHSHAELHQYPNKLLMGPGIIYQFLRHRLKYKHFPEVIPPGGSSVLGTTGFVNAAFELKKQIAEKEVPEPDYIYVALGTMGTAAGLLLGLKAADIKSKLITVRVVDKKIANMEKLEELFHKTNSYLTSLDKSFPVLEFPANRIEINHDFFGKKYALFTEEGMQAVRQIDDTEGIKLEGTYTGKTFAALISDATEKNIANDVILFWNTYNSKDFSDIITNIDYKELPGTFHIYFERKVQSLDTDA
ncbi:MAG: pyridoxal-phosphate dependent enzyme [Actinobacteria bacterium]|nr:pyridoxal-phosphate dependent enzyme [Actinomycetota bacterium]